MVFFCKKFSRNSLPSDFQYPHRIDFRQVFLWRDGSILTSWSHLDPRRRTCPVQPGPLIHDLRCSLNDCRIWPNIPFFRWSAMACCHFFSSMPQFSKRKTKEVLWHQLEGIHRPQLSIRVWPYWIVVRDCLLFNYAVSNFRLEFKMKHCNICYRSVLKCSIYYIILQIYVSRLNITFCSIYFNITVSCVCRSVSFLWRCGKILLVVRSW